MEPSTPITVIRPLEPARLAVPNSSAPKAPMTGTLAAPKIPASTPHIHIGQPPSM